MRGRTFSSKIQNVLLKQKKERGESFRKVKKQNALEWDDLDMQAELKSFLYIDRSLRANKDNLIDELNFKNVCN